MKKYLLKTALFVDFILATGFGLYSYFSPIGTFGTIILIPEQHEAQLLAMLAAFSVFYVIIGLVCLIGVFAKSPANQFIAVVMIIRHAWIGIGGIMDVGKPWIVGDPYPDIYIHATFVVLYGVGVVFSGNLKLPDLSQ